MVEKKSPWASGSKSVEFTPDDASDLVTDMALLVMDMFLERTKGMPSSLKGATAMALADRITGAFVFWLHHDDVPGVASTLDTHSKNIKRRIAAMLATGE